MSELQPLQKPNHVYSINLDRPSGDPRIYRVRIAGDANCDFFVTVRSGGAFKNTGSGRDLPLACDSLARLSCRAGLGNAAQIRCAL
jgi:hypothetical protein